MTHRSPITGIPMSRAAAKKIPGFKAGGGWRFLEGGPGSNPISPATSFHAEPGAA